MDRHGRGHEWTLRLANDGSRVFAYAPTEAMRDRGGRSRLNFAKESVDAAGDPEPIPIAIPPQPGDLSAPIVREDWPSDDEVASAVGVPGVRFTEVIGTNVGLYHVLDAEGRDLCATLATEETVRRSHFAAEAAREKVETDERRSEREAKEAREKAETEQRLEDHARAVTEREGMERRRSQQKARAENEKAEPEPMAKQEARAVPAWSARLWDDGIVIVTGSETPTNEEIAAAVGVSAVVAIRDLVSDGNEPVGKLTGLTRYRALGADGSPLRRTKPRAPSPRKSLESAPPQTAADRIAEEQKRATWEAQERARKEEFEQTRQKLEAANAAQAAERQKQTQDILARKEAETSARKAKDEANTKRMAEIDAVRLKVSQYRSNTRQTTWVGEIFRALPALLIGGLLLWSAGSPSQLVAISSLLFVASYALWAAEGARRLTIIVMKRLLLLESVVEAPLTAEEKVPESWADLSRIIARPGGLEWVAASPLFQSSPWWTGYFLAVTAALEGIAGLVYAFILWL